jgi:hypothetical protein
MDMRLKFAVSKYPALYFLFLTAAGSLYADGGPTPTGVEAVGILQYLPFIATFLGWAFWVALVLKLGNDNSKDNRGSWAESILPGWETTQAGPSQTAQTAASLSGPSVRPGPKDKSSEPPIHHAA